MALKQRRFLSIDYWVGPPAGGALVGPVLVSTSDYRHFHFWGELDAATLGPNDYEIIKVYPLGCTFSEVQACFAREFQLELAAEAGLDRANLSPFWAGLGQSGRQPCLAA